MSAPDSPEQHRLSMTAQQFQDLHVDETPARPSVQPEFIKDGKLVFTETKLRAENHLVIADRIKEFRRYRAQIEQNSNINLQQLTFPHEFIDILCALAQDSDESLGQLCNRINDLLSPFQRNEQYSERYTELIESTVRSITTRTKYGVLPRVLTQLDNGITMIPQYLSFSRREVSDISCLPFDLQEIIQQRRNARAQYSEHVTASFETLTPDQQLTLLQSKPQSKPHRKVHVAEEVRSPAEIELENEKRRKKEEERRIREEEKRKREEEKRKREEEKKLRDEERKKREEERRKKEQSQMRLTSLFVKAADEKPSHTAHDDSKSIKSTTNIFPSFYVKEHVSMHPWTLVVERPSSDFEQQLRSSKAEKNKPCEVVSTDLRTRYLQTLKESNPYAAQKRGIKRNMNLRSIFLGPNMSEENFNRLEITMKLLQFTEDVRPAYYGTWTKSSKRIDARHPLSKDADLVDYEHDSEGEWEPEGEGEEIQSGDEDEDDPSADIADPEDAGWLVPEGYLSEGEGVESDDERATKNASGPTMRPTRKHLAVRPVIIGPVFDDGDMHEDDTLKQYATRMLFDYASEKPYDPFKVDTEASSNTKIASSAGDDNSKRMAFTAEHESELINIINDGKADAIPKLVSEAKANWLLRDVSKRQLEMKIKDLAVKEKRGSDTKAAWHVKEA